jgi:small conductance mechanosensitive channel
MRSVFAPILFVFALALAMPGPAEAQTLAIHQASPAAKPAVSAIIPGSPLAALTGATTAAPANVETGPTPFGTEALGLSAANFISQDATRPLLAFISAVHKSTRLTPVWQWLGSFPSTPARQRELLEIVQGLAMTVLPGMIADAVIQLLLTRPRGLLIRRGGIAQTAGLPETSLDATAPGAVEDRSRRRETLRASARRLLLAVLVLLLNLLPILGFGLTAGVLLGAGFITARDARLAIAGVGNAYLFCRIAMEVLRFLIAPWAPPLRLFTLADTQALRLNKWLRILLVTGAVSYVVISISEILGLPAAGTRAVTRILVLAVHIELATMIWLARHVVAGWIRGRPDPRKGVAPWRQRLAAYWHYLALFYILALWVAWAAGVPNAFGALLRVVLCFMAAIILGRLGWSGSAQGLERLFPDPAGRDLKHPNFIGRARAYNPLIKTLIRICIIIVVLAVILLGWGIQLLPWLLKNPLSRSLLSALAGVLVIVAIALLMWEFASNWLDLRIQRLADAGKTRQALRLRTLLPILKATIGTAIGVVAGLFSLNRIGVNAAPLLAGAGVVGIAIGFGSQKLVQDIITGLFLLLEDTMQVGDVVTLAGMSGTVEALSIRTIRLRGGDGSMNIIPFSAVTTVTNQTRDFGYAQISVGVAYEENVDHVCAVLTDIARGMRKEPNWGSMMRDDLQINGLDQLGASALVITGQIRTGPGQHWAVRREFNRRMLIRFAEEHIEIPYTYLPPAPAAVPENSQPQAPAGSDPAAPAAAETHKE